MEDKLKVIKKWLGTGSINIFGLPMSGKDTQGVRLAEAIDGKFISSGLIIRSQEKALHRNYTGDGNLTPTNVFYEWVLPYFSRPDLTDYPLILSSIGRWYGEETVVMEAAANAGHATKAVLLLNISEADVENRFEAAKAIGDRGDRRDDKDIVTFRNRITEFREKTLPVLQHYKNLGLLININGDQSREAIFTEIVAKLYEVASQSRA